MHNTINSDEIVQAQDYSRKRIGWKCKSVRGIISMLQSWPSMVKTDNERGSTASTGLFREGCE